MKFKDYKRSTFKICMNYVKNPTNHKCRHQLEQILLRWIHSKEVEHPYDYSDRDVLITIEYCSDRMNKGRAQAILELL